MSQLWLGSALLFGNKAAAKDVPAAIRLLSTVTKHPGIGDRTPLALFLIACGLCELNKFEDAYTLVQDAAKMGYLPALFEQGVALYRGVGVRRDLAAAFACFLQAAERGQPIAQYAVAICYLEGISVPRDPEAAVEWAVKSAKAGCSDGLYLTAMCVIIIFPFIN